MNPLLLVDSYKIHHTRMYPEGMTKLYSNFTPRKSRIKGIDGVVVFGIQHFILKYLIEEFNKNFFIIQKNDRPFFSLEELGEIRDREVLEVYIRHCPVDVHHIAALWDLGYLPIEIKALDEGTICPIGVPMLTITNTHPDFGWLVNYLETLLSCCLWQAITSATIAHEYKKLLVKYAKQTGGDVAFVDWQGHDFSMRGMSSPESAILSGMGHLLSFTGTDTIPAIYELETYYAASGLIGASVPATEHSVMCMGKKEAEVDTFRRLLNLYPKGILSVVSDTWDLWKVLTVYLPELKDEILARDGKLVIRPDSGNPVDIICGTIPADLAASGIISEPTPSDKGVIELLWDIFGGIIVKGEDGNEYKQLDSHIGAIYGDSITLDRAREICERLKAKGFASTNIVLGIGSYTYQYNTRDTFGFAMKATYGEVMEDVMPSGRASVGREIWKDPITDDGTKKSKKGLLAVFDTQGTGEYDEEICGEFIHHNSTDTYVVVDQQTWDMEKEGALKTVFKDGVLTNKCTLEQVRKHLTL